MITYLATKSHKIIRHILYVLGGILALSTCIPVITAGQGSVEFPYQVNGGTNVSTDIVNVVKTEAVNPTNSILKKLTDFFKLSSAPYYAGSTSKALNYVKWILNMLLGLVSLVSLVMIIFAFYLIFFSKGEDGVAKAKKIFIGVAIALAIMGLSRFIASFFFNIYTTVT